MCLGEKDGLHDGWIAVSGSVTFSGVCTEMREGGDLFLCHAQSSSCAGYDISLGEYHAQEQGRACRRCDSGAFYLLYADVTSFANSMLPALDPP